MDYYVLSILLYKKKKKKGQVCGPSLAILFTPNFLSTIRLGACRDPTSQAQIPDLFLQVFKLFFTYISFKYNINKLIKMIFKLLFIFGCSFMVILKIHFLIIIYLTWKKNAFIRKFSQQYSTKVKFHFFVIFKIYIFA